MKTVFTAIFGKYDDLKEPAIVSKGWKHICYTDQDLKSDVWEIRKVPVMECGPAKTARWYKIRFDKHIDTEFSLWVDGTFIINVNLNRWWRRFVAPFTAVQHPYDNCIYTDAKSCIDTGKGDPRLIERQIALYRALRIPKNNGLIASGVLMRQNTQEVARFCRLWWDQVQSWTERDQIAWGAINFQMPGLVHRIEWNYQKQREFWHVPHLHKKYRTVPTGEELQQYASNKGRKRDLEHLKP